MCQIEQLPETGNILFFTCVRSILPGCAMATPQLLLRWSIIRALAGQVAIELN